MGYSTSVIKLQQQGVTNTAYAASGSPVTATGSITTIDLAKAVIHFNGLYGDSNFGTAPDICQGACSLTAVDTVTVYIFGNGNNRQRYIRWNVTEYY
jgi:hypothetical protein